MNYLFLGDDRTAKDKKIVLIKASLFTDPESFHFDYELLYGHKLAADGLKKALVALPALSAQRLIVLKQCHKLSPQAQEIVTAFLTNKPKHVVLILDSDEGELKGIFKEWSHLTQWQVFGKSQVPVVFEVTDAMSARNLALALKLLSGLYEKNVHPLQMMGILVWYWGKARERLTKDKFEQGLMALESADLNIKRSRLDPQYAVEKVVVELVTLQSPTA